MKSEPLPAWIVIGAALFSIAAFTGHYLFVSGKMSHAHKDFLFGSYMGKFGREAGLGLKYGAAGFGLLALGGILTYAPPGSLLDRISGWIVVAGFLPMLPPIYWKYAGYPERMKPGWYKDREARFNAGKRASADGSVSSVAAAGGVDDMILAGPEGWTPLTPAFSKRDPAEAPDRLPAVHEGAGTSCIKVDGYRVIPLVVELENLSSGPLEVRAGHARSAVDHWLASLQPGGEPSRLVLDDRELADGEPLAERYLQIKASGQWRAALRTLQDLRTFEEKATGTGFDVLHYLGPPGVAVIRQEGATAFSLQLRDSNLGRKRSAYQVLCPLPGGKGRVALPTDSVLQIGAEGAPWSVVVSPLLRQGDVAAEGRTALAGPGLEELRTFSTSIGGNTAEVLFYTGASGRLRVEHTGEGPFGIDQLHSTLGIAEEVLAAFGDYEGDVEIKGHSLLQIRGGLGTWSLQQADLEG
ncbi:hypothetical protein [Actinomadura sp. K4S16]|uniref:hypothetical protein n=1 Tax=Actinomadura sp. K4S16 TaxID=1316147 RepID=UPI0011EC51EF|nr:hypothetical protein [Actinomadura sp. K4S16]